MGQRGGVTNGLYYLATPYSRYDQGPEQAYKDACQAAAALLKRGLFVFSPVAHSHPIAMLGGIDPLSHSIWMPLDLKLLVRCNGLIVVMMPGWRESIGVSQEIAKAEELRMPISYFSWPMLNARENVKGEAESGS